MVKVRVVFVVAAWITWSSAITVDVCRAQTSTGGGGAAPQTPAEAPSASTLLDVVPGDAWAVFTWRDLRGFENRLAATGARISLPLPISPTLGAKAYLNMVDGWRDDGDVALALLSPATPQEEGDWGARMALFLPTSDLGAMIHALSPAPVDDKVFKVMLRGDPSYVARRGDYAVFAQNESVVRRVLASSSSLKGRFVAHQLERYGKNDLALWLDLAAITHSDSVRAFLAQQGAQPALINAIKSFSQVQVSLRLAEDGIAAETFWRGPRNAPEAVRGMEGATLLAGLPADGCALAGGTAVFDRETLRAWIDPLIGEAVQENVIAGEKSQELQKLIDRAAAHVRGIGLGCYALRSGPDGVAAATKIILTDGQTEDVLKTIEDYVALMRSGLFKLPALDHLAQTATFARGAETLGGVSVHHLRFDVSKVESVNAQTLQRVIGKDGLLLRVAVVGPRVVVSLGGGSEHMASVLSTLAQNKAPLVDAQGARASAQNLPTPYQGRWQVDVGQLQRVVDAILAEVDQKRPGSQPAPPGVWVVGVQRAIGDDGGEWDVFVPLAIPQWMKDALLAPPVQAGSSAPSR